MNLSTAQARVLVSELIGGGVHHAVLCPGSRNAPLAFALSEAERSGQLELHVRIDERVAGFLALGIAKATLSPVVMTCTSGTAVANLHPAVLEAEHARVPLIALTADRPVELHRAGASQTVDQNRMLGIDTLQIPEARLGHEPIWRSLMCRALAIARQSRPVHVNVPFREPLTPDDDEWPTSLRPVWTQSDVQDCVTTRPVDLPHRTLVVLGDDRPDRLLKAAKLGWPVIAEPTAPGGLPTGALLLNGDLPPELTPEAVVVVGRPTLSRAVQRLIRRTPVVHAVADAAEWADTQFVVTTAASWLPEASVNPDPEWVDSWRRAASAVERAVDQFLMTEPWPTGLHVARELVDMMPPNAALFVGASNSIRHVDFASRRRDDLRIYANRGAAGIDGNVSTATGIAMDNSATYALLGDLAFLHDANGLLSGPYDRRPNLVVVVLNDDGGGIFSLLEQGEDRYAASFERIFGTPQGADLSALCAALKVPHTAPATPAEFREALAPAHDGIRVVEVRAARGGLRDLHQRLCAAAAAALGSHR